MWDAVIQRRQAVVLTSDGVLRIEAYIPVSVITSGYLEPVWSTGTNGLN